jgi:hypothetical protein
VETFCRAGQAIDKNMAHAHCMLGTQGYKYTLSEHVILTVFSLQQWLHEGASVLRFTYEFLVMLGFGIGHARLPHFIASLVPPLPRIFQTEFNYVGPTRKHNNFLLLNYCHRCHSHIINQHDSGLLKTNVSQEKCLVFTL